MDKGSSSLPIMKTYNSHVDLLADIDTARDRLSGYAEEADTDRLFLDTCWVIFHMHKAKMGGWHIYDTPHPVCEACYRQDWPCPTVLVMIDAATRMGAL